MSSISLETCVELGGRWDLGVALCIHGIVYGGYNSLNKPNKLKQIANIFKC